MRLSRNSDYSLRILIFMTLHDRLVQTSEIAVVYGISRARRLLPNPEPIQRCRPRRVAVAPDPPPPSSPGSRALTANA
jgi:hypothetical protein